MTCTRTKKKAASSLVAGGALAVLVTVLAPVGAASAATVPIDLYAVAGSTVLPVGGQNVTVWGYSSTPAAVSRPGGPTVIVNAGDTVEVTLHNQLNEPTALLFQGQDMIPDRTGAAPAGTTQYTFTASKPGTYLYEAGLLPNAQHQVAMGLYGALIVRPAATGQAYDDPATAFDDEAVLVLSEIDPALNNAANPANFDMRKYAPRYFLINGKAHPNTDPIPTAAGRTVLLRYVNAGNQYHSMAVLGAHQAVIALDGSPLSFARRYVADTFGPGQTSDALITSPASTTDHVLTLHDGSLLLHNSNRTGSGGMLAFVAAAGTGGGTDTSGPAASGVAYAAGDLTASLDETATGGATVQAAEYYLDATAPGTGTAMIAADGAFGAAIEAVTVTVGVPAGQHILYVRGQDSVGNWGVFSSVLVNGGDVVGPATTAATLSPNPTNGSADVTLHATGDDTATGGSDIATAEYFIDTIGADGTGTPMTVNTAAPIASLDATIPAATLAALAEGTHTVSMHSADATGSWGPAAVLDVVVDKTGPTAADVSAAPNPTNGAVPFNASTPGVRLTATLSDPVAGGVNSSIAAAEAFLDTVAGNGTGIALRAGDGAFNSPSEAGYADLPLPTILALSNGPHTISVHARDAAGTWGAVTTTTLVVDKVRPTLSAVVATPNPTLGAATATLSATAIDTLTAVTRAEWFRGADPGVGNATPMTITGTGPWTLTAAIDVSSWNEGTHTLTVRARDAATNWSSAATTVLAVRAPLFLSTLGNTNPPGVGGTADDADLYSWTGTAYARTFDASAAGLPAGADVDGYDRIDATHFYLSFADNTTVPGIGAVQDEDIVFYDAGTWSVFFDGTARGLTAANEDLDAISIAGSTVYFSTVGNTNPPGVGGTADDADIYSWNGTSFARVWDATAAGLAAAANVDSYVRVDATHFWLSFSPASTAVPVLGTVQDEDVVRNNNGVWSSYFDGTAHGLGTSDNLDVDAFDIP